MKKHFILFEVQGVESANVLKENLVLEGAIPAAAVAFSVNESTERLMEALVALDDMGDPDSLKILNLIDRLLAEDWSGTGVYEAIDNVLMTAESVVALHKALPFTELSVE